MRPKPRVAIVGAGWAGLACAVELVSRGLDVCVFESARQPGGRAREITLDGRQLDNGPHLLIGAYRATRNLMARLGSAHLLHTAPLTLSMPPHFDLRLPQWPAPLHLAWGLLTAQGISPGEKLAAARFMAALKRYRFRLPSDDTVTALLQQHQQSPRLNRLFWEPLCLAALNTPAEAASAQIFANVLQDSLGGPREATDMLLPRVTLGQLVPQPALSWLRQRGQTLALSSRAQGLERRKEGWQLTWTTPTTCEADTFDQVVIATAPQHTAALLPPSADLEPLRRQLDAFTYQPIATLYLAYPETLALPSPLLGLAGPIGQWVFDRGVLAGQGGLMACVLSAHGPWEALTPEALTQALHQELENALGTSLPPPHWHRLVREARATFTCSPNLQRPPNATALPGLWLAGDYTAGNYPATLEGAVRSGLITAEGIAGTLTARPGTASHR